MTTLSTEQSIALQKFKEGKNIFVTGPGGTGKTKLVEHFVKYAKEANRTIAVCAMTGCAAVLLGCNARTLHSWSGIKLAKGEPATVVSSVLRNKNAVKSWKRAKCLILDEVSMLSKKLFDIIEEIARSTRSSSRPFGGLQVVFTGDFYQLPPVGTEGDPDTERFCFESDRWSEVFPPENNIELVTMFRQKDMVYIDILREIRIGNLTEENKRRLQDYVKREFNPEEHNDCVPTKLFPLRAQADYVNNTMFSKLKGEEHVYELSRRADYLTYTDNNREIPADVLQKCKGMSEKEIEYEIAQLIANCPAPQVLRIKRGAAVMSITNLDMDAGICNGSQGIVQDISPMGDPIVKFSNGLVKLIQRHYWQSDEYPTIVIGQYPICLAWAMTIHKIQGATLDMAEMDLGQGIFEYGQTYVALSRIKSLDGLYLSAFHAHRIRANPKVGEFYKKIQGFPKEFPKEFPKSSSTKTISVEENVFSEFRYVPEPHSEPIPTLKIIKHSADVISATSSRSTKKPSTAAVSFALFVEGKNMDEIAESRKLKRNTIVEHIIQCLPDDRVQASHFMTASEEAEIKACFDAIGSDVPLKMIKESISSTISYDQIKAYHKIHYA